jgi:hypothetical protein
VNASRWRGRAALAACLIVAASARPGAAWEAATTHAGLTEQAALASGLHERIRSQFGLERGLFDTLTVPPADAPELFEILRRLNPTHGYVPDARGRMHALGWLVAGSVVADSPAELAANHFFDPSTGKGLSDHTLDGLAQRLTAMFRGDIARSGVATADWLDNPKNPMSLSGFRSQYAKAVTARTPGERARHLAGALLAAGAMLHLLEDMGSPSHVRDDLAAHLERLGPDGGDLGSRFERVAALAYGRLGVPTATPLGADDAKTARPLRDFFTARDGSGLADRTAASWFSPSTLPRSLNLGGDPRAALSDGLKASLRRPAPALPSPASIDLEAAAEDRGAELSDQRGVCVARYRVVERRLSWFIDDACALEQVSAILPVVTSYAAGMLDTLFRGSLSLESEGGPLLIRAGAADLGRGKLSLFWDDAAGVRTLLKEVAVEPTAGGQVLAGVTGIPAAARRVSVLFEGTDPAGQPLLAAGTGSYPITR